MGRKSRKKRPRSPKRPKLLTVELGGQPVVVATAPLGTNATSSRDLSLGRADARRLELVPRWTVRLAGLSFMVFGALPSVAGVQQALKHGATDLRAWVDVLLPILISLGFVSLGAYIFAGRRVRFDRGAGLLTYRGFWTPRTWPLRNVLAVQLIDGGWHHGKKRRYYTYELNLVLNDPQTPRLNVSCHPDQAWTRDAGRRIAAFLQVPLSDALTTTDPPPARW